MQKVSPKMLEAAVQAWLTAPLQIRTTRELLQHALTAALKTMDAEAKLMAREADETEHNNEPQF